jgi:sigma-B regulation protein RsbU (phosphoserine phosphatase)
MFAKTITRPLEKLALDAGELAKGKFDIEINVEGRDEIGQLATNFDTMRKSIKNLIGELEEANENLEQKVIERTKGLQQANERIKSILENAPFAMITIDEQKEIVVFNPAAERTFGYKADEVIGKHLDILIPENSRSIHDELIDQFSRENTVSRPLDNRRPIGGLKKDGSIFPLEAGISKLKLSSKMFYTAFAIDITDRKAAEEKLIRQSTALESAANGIGITDIEGVILWVNPSFTKLTGYTYEQAVGQKTSILNSGKHESAFFTKMWETINSGRVWHGELTNKRKDGSLYTEEMTITPVNNEKNEVINYIAIKQDITERKKLEKQLEEANKRMKGELDIGREIQMSMLPLIFPAFPDHQEFSIYAKIKPAREVGGDYYDFFFISDSHFCFGVGDVSGKGVPSALFMAVTKTLIKSRATVDFSTASIVTHVNDELSEDNSSNMFVTDFIGILNIYTGELTYTNAGHNPPFIKRSDGTVEKLDKRHGPVIGAMSGMTYDEDRIFLRKGDKIILYTDGVTEAMDKLNNLYSEKRFINFLMESKFISNESVVNKVIEEVNQFEDGAEQADDITVLSLEFKSTETDYENKFLEVKLVNKLIEIPKLNEKFNKFAKKNNIPKAISGKINLVFDELINNTISYAYTDDLEHYIDVKIDLSPGRLTISIIDDGVPFNPFQFESPDTSLKMEDREIGGLGIHLVKNVMDRVSYNRGINKNIVTLVKKL